MHTLQPLHYFCVHEMCDTSVTCVRTTQPSHTCNVLLVATVLLLLGMGKGFWFRNCILHAWQISNLANSCINMISYETYREFCISNIFEKPWRQVVCDVAQCYRLWNVSIWNGCVPKCRSLVSFGCVMNNLLVLISIEDQKQQWKESHRKVEQSA